MKQKKKLWAIAIVIILIALLVGNSLAYYSVQGTATNVVTSGNIRLKIIETGANGLPYPKDSIEIIPGQTVTKQVVIQNTCSHPFWLRVEIITGSNNSAKDVIEILDLNHRDWKEHDGYYYYNTILQPSEITAPLFSQVLFSGQHLNETYSGTDLTLSVRASAVQSENNPAEHPWEALGWPES